MIALALRSVAVAIAIAAVIDPPMTLTARGRSRVAVHVSDAGTVPSIARASAETLARNLRDDFDVVSGRDDEAAAAVFVGGRYPAAPPPEAQRVFTVTTTPCPGRAGCSRERGACAKGGAARDVDSRRRPTSTHSTRVVSRRH